MKIRQFDIWLVNLNPSKGSEQNGKRPCIVLQTNAGNDYGSTTIIAPCTTKKLSRVYAFEVKINPSRQNGLTEKSKIKFDQIRVIDKAQLVKKLGGLENNFHILVKFSKNFFSLAWAKPQKLFEKFASKSENFVTKLITRQV